jgi:outer membrane receptor protein involved in Fe transport
VGHLRVGIIGLVVWLLGGVALQAAGDGGVTGTVADQSGARLPGVGVQVVASAGARALASAITDAQGVFSIDRLPEGEYWVEFALPGFARSRHKVAVVAGATQSVSATLGVDGLSEAVRVSAGDVRLDVDRPTLSATFSNEMLADVPSPSRNYTHVIVAEAGVSAPLPDRTGRNLNLATEPGAQAEDGSQTLNPSVNGARPTNNALRVNGIDTTNMLSASGGLGGSLGVPLEALQEIEVSTSLTTAAQGRNGGGSIDIVTRQGTNRFNGTGLYAFQHEAMNANEFFLNRAGTAKPEFRRSDASGAIGGPIRHGRTFFFAAGQSTRFRSGYASNATAAAGLPVGLGDVRTPETIAQVANEWMRNGAADNPAFAANFLRGLQAFPAEQQAGLIAKFFSNVSTLTFRPLTAADIHPVAINILNVKRDGQFLIPSATGDLPVLRGNGTYGRELLLQQVIPTESNGWSGVATVQHRLASGNDTRVTFVRSQQQVEEAFGWADASPSPTNGNTPALLGGVSNTHTFGSRLLQEVSVGYFDLENTRISKYRDILNSTLGIRNPLEESIGGLAALMPTIDINTQRNSGGIGNAWDFFDRQRVLHASARWSLATARHTLQSGVEYRRFRLDSEYMSRTNGDLDYGNWVFFFTGHGAAGGGSDLDQGDTRRDFRAQDAGFFLQDDWKVGGGLTVNAGLRYDVFGMLTERNGRIGNYYLPEVAAELGASPGFNVPGNAPFFEPGFDPLQIGLYVVPGTSIDTSGIHAAPNDSTLRGDRNNVAPRVGFAWQPEFARKFVVRGGWGLYYERPSAGFKVDLQRAAPFFIYQNVPAPLDMADPYPQLNVNPFQIPLNVRIVRDASGAPRWVKGDGSAFPSMSPFSAKNNTFIDPLVETPSMQQWSTNLQWEASRQLLVDLRYVGSRGQDLLGKINLALPLDPRVTPVNGFTDIRDAQGRLINPDFFVPAEFLGLSRNGGFAQLTNIGRSTYHSFQGNLRGRFGTRAFLQAGYTFGKTLDTLSSDRSLVEHDPRRPENNYGFADYDRTHRLTTAWVLSLPASDRPGLLRALARDWQVSGLFTWQSGTPFSVLGASTTNAIFAQPSRVRLSYAPGATLADAQGSGPITDRLDDYFDVAAFRDSGDAWGDTGRNILRGPSQRQVDLSVSRQLSIAGGQRIELRWEVFNVFNEPVFANPASTFAANGPGNAGRITSTIGGPRTMQLGVKYVF